MEENELIDTLWNVNEYVARLLYTLLGINRYIMECKYPSSFLPYQWAI